MRFLILISSVLLLLTNVSFAHTIKISNESAKTIWFTGTANNQALKFNSGSQGFPLPDQQSTKTTFSHRKNANDKISLNIYLSSDANNPIATCNFWGHQKEVKSKCTITPPFSVKTSGDTIINYDGPEWISYLKILVKNT